MISEFAVVMSAWAPSLFARANALSKSSRPRTGSDRSLSPNALAAASMSVRVRFPLVPPDGQRKATRATLGKASLSSSNRLPSRSGDMALSPVIFPSGRARLETSPSPTGSPTEANTMGIVGLAFLAAKIAAGEKATMTSTFETDQFGCKVRQPFAFPVCIAVLNDNVFFFDVPKLTQPLAKCFDPGRNVGCGGPGQNSYPGNSRRLLRRGDHSNSKVCHDDQD